jgi:hypothetical protein
MVNCNLKKNKNKASCKLNLKCWRKVGKDKYQSTEGDIIRISREHTIKNKTIGYNVSLNPYHPPSGYQKERSIGGRKIKSQAIKFAKRYMKKHGGSCC